MHFKKLLGLLIGNRLCGDILSKFMMLTKILPNTSAHDVFRIGTIIHYVKHTCILRNIILYLQKIIQHTPYTIHGKNKNLPS